MTTTSGSLNPVMKVRELEGCRAELDMRGQLPDLEATVPLMKSSDYQDRVRAEYWQTKIRYEKLKQANTKAEAIFYADGGRLEQMKKERLVSYTSQELMSKQQRVMGEYLHILEIRAEIENIVL